MNNHKVKKPEEKDTVEVSKSFLKTITDKLERLEKDRDLLLSVADKKRLARYFQRHKEHTPNKVSLRMIDGKIVMGWKSTKDVVKKVSIGKWVEDQQTKLVLEDGSTKDMSQRDFELLHEKVECKRVGIITDEETGKIAFKLIRLDNGKEYTVDVTFVN